MLQSKIPANKEKLRTYFRELRNGLSPDYRKQISAEICLNLLEFINHGGHRIIHSYLPIGNEVDVEPLLAELLDTGRQVIVPKTLPDRQMEHYELKNLQSLHDGIFGTRYPFCEEVYTGDYQVILVPGLSFDQKGHRLGYGAGYYDVFLQDTRGIKIGVAFPEQLSVDDLPNEAHDISMDYICMHRLQACILT